jgi:phosphocarrier protein HPr
MTLLRKARVDADTVEADVEIINQLGLHARAAARFVEAASRFVAEVTVTNGDESVSGKSILGLMMLAAGQGTQLKLVANGPDADEAVDALVELIGKRFFESS